VHWTTAGGGGGGAEARGAGGGGDSGSGNENGGGGVARAPPARADHRGVPLEPHGSVKTPLEPHGSSETPGGGGAGSAAGGAATAEVAVQASSQQAQQQHERPHGLMGAHAAPRHAVAAAPAVPAVPAPAARGHVRVPTTTSSERAPTAEGAVEAQAADFMAACAELPAWGAGAPGVQPGGAAWVQPGCSLGAAWGVQPGRAPTAAEVVPVVPSVAADAFTAACTELGALGALVVAAQDEPSTPAAAAAQAPATAVPGAPAFVPAVLVVPAAAEEPSAAAPAAHTVEPPAAHAVAVEDPCVAAPASAAYSRCVLRSALSLSEWGLLGEAEVGPSPAHSVRSGSALRNSLSSEDLRSLGLGTSGHAGSAALHNSGSAALTFEELSRLLEVGGAALCNALPSEELLRSTTSAPPHPQHSGFALLSPELSSLLEVGAAPTHASSGAALRNALSSDERSLRSFPVGTTSSASPQAGHAALHNDSDSDLSSEELSRLLEVGGAALFNAPSSEESPHPHAGRTALRSALSPDEMCSMEVGIADAVGALERSACRGAPRTPRGLRLSLA
jgi:hypothetical protein